MIQTSYAVDALFSGAKFYGTLNLITAVINVSKIQYSWNKRANEVHLVSWSYATLHVL